MNKLLCEQDPACLSNRNGRRSQVLQEEPAQLTFAYTKPLSKLLYTAIPPIQSAVAD
jgi:hypothetical protein